MNDIVRKLSLIGIFIVVMSSVCIAAAPEGAKVVYPEVATRMQMSSVDVNRLVCAEKIKDIVYSKEKGITVRYSGKDAYIKFLIEVKFGEKQYISSPTELFVVCGETTYNIIAEPKANMPAQTIYLSSGKGEMIKKNISLYQGMPLEEKILSILKSVYTSEIPDSFAVVKGNKKYNVFRDLNLSLIRTIYVEGEGFVIKEYNASVKGSTPGGVVVLKEKDFLLKELVSNPAGIAIDKHNLREGDIARIFMIERTSDGNVN